MSDTVTEVVPDRVDPPAPAVSRPRARVAGAVAALVALAVGELVSATAGTDQSLIASVGTQFINQFAGPLKDLAIALFGTNDKVALIIGILIVSTLLGAAFSVASTRRRWVGPAGFAAFGAFGLVAGLLDPQTAKPLVVVASLAATAAGIATLEVLRRIAATGTVAPVPPARPVRIDTPTNPAASRRTFFTWAGAATAFAAASAGAAKSLSGRSNADIARDAVRLPTVAGGGTIAPGTTVAEAAPLGVPGLTPYYIPNDDFYRIDTALIVPHIDPAGWRLKISGMVDHPFELGFDELVAMAQVEESATLQCVSNEIGGDLVGNARWQGVPLKALLDRAGVQPGASQIVGVSQDGWTAGFPTDVALDGRVCMIAVGMNGEALPIIHGFPARLVVAGLYGYVSATKWLTDIRLTTWDGFDGYWIPRGWSKLGPIKTVSRIDVPRRGADLTAGATKIAGIALAPSRGIQKVEVRVDKGAWQVARLGDTVSKNTWVQWVLDWDATPGTHAIEARATDATGATQTEETAPPAPDGATGWATRIVDVS